MESVTYNCYTAEDLAAQSQTFLTAIQNLQTALLKVAENDVNAGTLEEIKALLGVNADATTAPKTSEPATEGMKPETPSTDTKDAPQAVSEPMTKPDTDAEPHTVTVQPGDTLQTLAEKTGATPRHLIEANMLMEPVVLHPGQTLKY